MHRVALSNTDIARKLLEMRTLMEMAGETFYKYTAFEKAAASVENAPPLRDVVAAGELTKMAGTQFDPDVVAAFVPLCEQLRIEPAE